ncbi:unnamed protein product [Larinioides sclopetarius]|uniref:Uncharacterized protein n=1 Tax=Larinioides sclopetarius TaxID=280406 RepID=A0AAV2A2Y8_9ARAC
MDFISTMVYNFLTTSLINESPENTLVYIQILAMKSFLFAKHFQDFWFPKLYVKCSAILFTIVGFYFLPCLKEKFELELFIIILHCLPLCSQGLEYRLSTISNYIFLLIICFYCVTTEVFLDIYVVACLVYQMTIYTEFCIKNETVFVILFIAAYNVLSIQNIAYLHALFVSCECLVYEKNRNVNLLHVLIILSLSVYMHSSKHLGVLGRKYLRHFCENLCTLLK